MSGDWGWDGQGDRALEFPEDGEQTDVSPPDRARVRYNTTKQQLEASENGSDYSRLALSGSPTTGPTAQAEFFIDPVNGNDNNSGASASEAIATWAEYRDRVGLGVVTASPWQQVNLLNDLPASDPVVVEAQYRNGLVVQGQRTVLISGTVTTATAWDLTTTPVTPGTLEDAGLSGDWSDSGPGGSSLIGKQIVMTSGANIGKTGWLLDDLGGKVARISQLFDVMTFTTGTPAPGDTFDVIDLTVVAGGVDVPINTAGFVNIDRCDVTADQPIQADGGIIVPTDSKFVQTGPFTLSISNATFQSSACLWTNSLDYTSLKGTGTFFANSFIDARVRVTNASLLYFNVNPLQKAGGTFATSNAFTCSTNGDMFVNSGAGLGVMDQSAGSPTAFFVLQRGMFSIGATGVAFTLDQTVGRGCAVASYGNASWASSTDAPTTCKFDVSGPAIEWAVGGVTTTSVALGALGTINAANNAGAVANVG